MPAMHAIFQRMMPKVFGSTENTGYDNYSHSRSGDRRKRSGNSLAFGIISKSVDVKVQREDRSESDIALVPGRPPC
jgi:hypothetical protein